MPSPILDRIAATTGVPHLVDLLAATLSPGDLQSLLLEVCRARAARTAPADVAARAADPLCAPSAVEARRFNAFDQLAFAAAPAFEALDVSPVAPLGTTHALGDIDQNNLLTTIRRAEVLGDNTTALALVAATRRRTPAARTDTTRLCSSQRVVRLQPFDVPGYSPHFRLFALVSAGRDRGSMQFEGTELRTHVGVYLALFRALNEHGYALDAPHVEISHPRLTQALLDRVPGAGTRVREAIRAHHPGGSSAVLAALGISLPDAVDDPARDLAELAASPDTAGFVIELSRLRSSVAEPIGRDYPEATVTFTLARLEGLAYYTGPCFRISPRAADGERFPIVDGGVVDWTARLLNDRKERVLASGIGTEFVCKRYLRA